MQDHARIAPGLASQYKGSKVGFPIRRSLDQSSFAAPQGISQRTTSFIASQRQGIHQMLLRHLIALMIHGRRFRDAMCCSPCTLGKRSTGHQKDRPSALAKGLFCLPNGSGSSSPAGPPAGGQVEIPAAPDPFPLYDFKHPQAAPQGADMRVPVPAGFSRNRTADLFDFPDSTIPPGPLVEPDGIEPTTSCLQSTRSTN
jgi:hypothetical protein